MFAVASVYRKSPVYRRGWLNWDFAQVGNRRQTEPGRAEGKMVTIMISSGCTMTS